MAQIPGTGSQPHRHPTLSAPSVSSFPESGRTACPTALAPKEAAFVTVAISSATSLTCGGLPGLTAIAVATLRYLSCQVGSMSIGKISLICAPSLWQPRNTRPRMPARHHYESSFFALRTPKIWRSSKASDAAPATVLSAASLKRSCSAIATSTARFLRTKCPMHVTARFRSESG